MYLVDILVEWFGRLGAYFDDMSSAEITWLAIGFLGQSMFFMRFLFQWIYSERARRSVIPEIFWYFSFAGGSILLAYVIYRADPVLIVGQATGLFIYSRNIYWVWRDKLHARQEVRQAKDVPAE